MGYLSDALWDLYNGSIKTSKIISQFHVALNGLSSYMTRSLRVVYMFVMLCVQYGGLLCGAI